MPQINFKATRHKHSSGYAVMEKSGDLQYDLASGDGDVIILYTIHGDRITIDCNHETHVFSVKFSSEQMKTYDNMTGN